MNASSFFIAAAVLALAAAILRYTLWRAVLFLSPSSIRIDVEDPGAARAVPASLRAVDAELLKRGFRPLGTHSERPVLGPSRVCWNYVHEADATAATIQASRDETPHVYFLSRLANGGLVLTFNYQRPAREQPGRYASGWLENVPLERVLRAHTRRLAGFDVRTDPLTLEARVDLQRAWYGGLGRPEVRQQNVRGLLWTLGTLGMVAAAIFTGAGR